MYLLRRIDPAPPGHSLNHKSVQIVCCKWPSVHGGYRTCTGFSLYWTPLYTKSVTSCLFESSTAWTLQRLEDRTNISGRQLQCQRPLQCSLTVSQCSAMQCSAVECSAVQCSAVQCSAVQCSVSQVYLHWACRPGAVSLWRPVFVILRALHGALLRFTLYCVMYCPLYCTR